MTRLGRIAIVLFALTGFGEPTLAKSTDGVLHFTINTAESTITAAVAEPMAMIRGEAVGKFKVLGGEVQGNPSSIASTGQVELTIDAASYDSGDGSRDEDVKRNSLEVQTFPTISFRGDRASSVRTDDKGRSEVELSGKLTLHGVTKAIVVPLTTAIDASGRLTVEGEYTFKFEEYGVKRPSKMMGMMKTGDEATISFHVVADPV